MHQHHLGRGRNKGPRRPGCTLVAIQEHQEVLAIVVVQHLEPETPKTPPKSSLEADIVPPLLIQSVTVCGQTSPDLLAVAPKALKRPPDIWRAQERPRPQGPRGHLRSQSPPREANSSLTHAKWHKALLASPPVSERGFQHDHMDFKRLTGCNPGMQWLKMAQNATLYISRRNFSKGQRTVGPPRSSTCGL